MALLILNYFVFICMCISAANAYGRVLYRSNEGTMMQYIINSANQSMIYMKCSKNYTLTDVFPPSNETITAIEIKILQCVLPPRPLIETFQNLNINALAVESMHLEVDNYGLRDMTYDSYELPPANYTKGLKIRSFSLSSSSPNFFRNNRNFFQPLLDLTSLKLNGNGLQLPSLSSNKPEVLSLRGVILKDWGNCENLKNLTFKGWITVLPAWPENCTQLSNLDIWDMAPETVQQLMRNVSKSNGTLQFLKITSCSLRDLSAETLSATRYLRHLDLRENKLSDDVCSKFPVLENLTTLRLQNNELTSSCLKDLVPKLPTLRFLTLDNNNFARTFSPYNKKLLGSLSFLEELEMDGMAMKPGCLEDVHFSSLRYLSLTSDEPARVFKINALPTTDAPLLKVNLRWGKIMKTVYDQTKKPWFKSNKTKLEVLVGEVDCDCSNSELVETLRANPEHFQMPEARCSGTGRLLLEEPLENMDCFRVKHEDCSIRWQHKEKPWAKVDCANLDLKKLRWKELLHDYANPIQLNASGNYLTSLHDADLPDSLEWIDLRNNHLSRLDVNETAKLFSSPTRRVWLGGNSFICDCKHRDMLEQLYKHQDQVVDYKSLVCVDSGLKLHTRVGYVCSVGKDAVWTTCCVMAFLIVFSMVVLRRFSREMRLILYSHGYCMRCVSEEDLDSDRPYDAFVSFAHGDQAFVTDFLIPRLEAMSDEYRVCVHYRDWVIGDWIPAQIMRSVRLSKRTIIVLSRNFVESSWGTLEFRYAQASATWEGRSRLLVLVKDDVLSMKLEPELQGYLAYNTFLHCDDPWFWEKLRYAMPRKDNSVSITSQPTTKSQFDLSNIKMDAIPLFLKPKDRGTPKEK